MNANLDSALGRCSCHRPASGPLQVRLQTQPSEHADQRSPKEVAVSINLQLRVVRRIMRQAAHLLPPRIGDLRLVKEIIATVVRIDEKRLFDNHPAIRVHTRHLHARIVYLRLVGISVLRSARRV